MSFLLACLRVHKLHRSDNTEGQLPTVRFPVDLDAAE